MAVSLKDQIGDLVNNYADVRRGEAREAFARLREALNDGKIRAAEKVDGQWRVNEWVRKGTVWTCACVSLVAMADGSASSCARTRVEGNAKHKHSPPPARTRKAREIGFSQSNFISVSYLSTEFKRGVYSAGDMNVQ